MGKDGEQSGKKEIREFEVTLAIRNNRIKERKKWEKICREARRKP